MRLKRFGYFASIFILIALLLAGFVTVAMAEGNNAEGEAKTAIWEKTKADGSVEYFYSFSDAFKNIADGDYYKFLPEYYEVYLADYAKLRPSTFVKITVDLRGSTIVAPETGDVNGQIFDISDKHFSRYTILLENSKIYAAPGGRCAFSAGNTSIVEMDGGEAGGIIYAGGALNLSTNYVDEDTYSIMKNLYCYKSTGNMAGMICARNTSKLKLVDCYAVSTNKTGVPLYVRNAGEMIIENSHGISLDGGTVVQFVEHTEGMKFTLGKGSTLYGNIKDLNDPVYMSILSETVIQKAYSANISANSILNEELKTITHHIYTSAAVGADSLEALTFEYAYSVIPDSSLENSMTGSSVWKLEGENGTKYAKDLSAVNSDLGKYNKVTLLCNLELEESQVIKLGGDLAINFNGKTVKVKEGADIGFAFNFSGEGNVTVNAGSGNVDLIGCGFIRATNKGTLILTSSANVVADTVVSFPVSEGKLTIKGGNYLVRLGEGFVSYSDIDIENISAVSLMRGDVVLSLADTNITKSIFSSYKNSYAVRTLGTLKMSSENYFIGKVKADTIDAEDSNYFTFEPEFTEMQIILIGEKTEADLSFVTIGDNGIELLKSTFEFNFYTEKYILTDTKEEDSIWMLEDASGNKKYTNHIYTPFVNIEGFVKYSLLSDVIFEKNITINMAGDFEISFDNVSVFLSENFTKETNLFEVYGDGALKISFVNSVINIPDAVFVYAEGIKSVDFAADGGFILAKTVCNTSASSISANGGYYSVTSGAFNSNGGEVELSNLTAYAPSGDPLVIATTDVTINENVILVSPIGAELVRAGERLMVADGVQIFGKAFAKEFYSAGDVGFSFKPEVSFSNMLIVQERVNSLVSLKNFVDGEIKVDSKRMTLAYKTVNITDGLKASMTLSSYASLNVFVPASVVSSDSDFRLRIVLDGLLYEADAEDGRSLVVEGKAYVKFVYPYVYPDLYSENVELSLISGKFEGSKTLQISDYLERAISLTESDLMKTVIASYARYSSECSGVKLTDDSPFTAYVKHIEIYEEEESEDLFDYFRAIRYEPTQNELRFTPWASSKYSITIRYKYADKNLSYTFDSKDGAFEIPIFKFDMTSELLLTITDDEGMKFFNIDLYELAYFADEGSDTKMLLTLYLAYANSVYEYNAQ